VDNIPVNLSSSFKVGYSKNGYLFSLAFGMLNSDYVSPSDLAQIGYYSVYLEQWVVGDDGVWKAISIPLKYHKCTKNDLPNFYEFQREKEIT
jgi:hypothetical protein